MKNQNWINKNLHLFEGIEAGIIYCIFKNEKPMPFYKGIQAANKDKIFITKIAACEECGTKKAGKKLRKSACPECLRGCRSQKMIHRYYKNKPPEKKGVTPKQVWYNGLIPGIIYCVFEGDEILRFEKVKHLFKPGCRKLSPVTGAHYIGRICVCGNCGKKRFSRVRLGDLCKKCQNTRNTKSCEEKKSIKTANQIAYEITGDYQRVENKPCIVDVLGEVEGMMTCQR